MRAVAFAVLTFLSLAAGQGPDATAVVRGRVIDAVTRKPLGHVPIRFSPQMPDGQRYGVDPLPPSRNTQSRPNGTFEVADLAPGHYSIYGTTVGEYIDISYGVRRPGGSSAKVIVGERADLDITIEAWPGASIAGSVVDSRGRPVVGAQVRAVMRGTSGPTTMTDDRGAYLFTRLRPGEYTVGVPLTLASRTVNAAPPSRPASGYIPPLQPYLIDPDARTILTPHGAPLPPPTEDGRPKVYVTSYYGGASPEDASYVSLETGQAREGIDVVLKDVPATRVSGVAAGPDGPTPGVVLALTRAGIAGPSYLAGRISATAAADGRFVFLGVPPDTYVLTAYRRNPPYTEVTLVDGAAVVAQDDYTIGDKDQLWAEMPLAVGGEEVSGLEVPLRKGTPVTGRFVSDDRSVPNPGRGTPPFSLISAALASDEIGSSATFAGNADGTFTGRVRPGRYVLGRRGSINEWSFAGARLGGRELDEGGIVIGDEPVVDLEIVLAPGPTSLSGTVIDGSGHPFADGTVVLFPSDPVTWPRLSQSERGRILRPGTAAYQLAGIPAGEYFILALDERTYAPALDRPSLEPLASRASRVRVVPGQPIRMNLTIVQVGRR